MTSLSWRWGAAAVTVMLLSVQVWSFPGGAPQSTCGDLTPRHHDNPPQSSASPYTLSPALQRVGEGTKLRLVLSSPSGEPIKGFMVQARAPGVASGALGSFTDIPGVAKTLTCGSGIRNTLTHTDREVKKSVEVEWDPPANFDGSVVFNSTILTDFSKFWVGVVSDRVQVVKRSASNQGGSGGKGISTTKIPIRVTTESNYVPTNKPQMTKANLHKIYTGCDDKKKICFGFPEGCTTDGSGACEAMAAVAWSPTTNVFTFELLGTNSPGYVAVGLSSDAKMGDDQVVQCNSAAKLALSKNVGYKNNPVASIQGIELKEATTDGGILYCKFDRDAKTTIENVVYDLGSTEYFLLVAKGDLKENDAVSYHTGGKSATGTSLKLSEVTIVAAKSSLLYRLHGTFMLAAWIGCAGTGMLIARYFKKTWVGKQVCGKDIWFSTHRGLMVLTWLLTNAAFIMIFVEVGGWYDVDNPHAVLGVITTALCFIQPFAATFRPAPSDSKRPIFNWSHWGVGNLAHLLAVVTIFYARKLNKAELPEWNDYIVAAYVAFHVFMHILFSITDFCSQRPSDRGNNFPMKEMGAPSRLNTFSQNSLDAPLTCLRRLLLAVYLLVILLLTIALIVVAAMAPIDKNETFQQVVSYITPLMTGNNTDKN